MRLLRSRSWATSKSRRILPDDASLDLALDFDLVMKITEELRKEGRLVEA